MMPLYCSLAFRMYSCTSHRVLSVYVSSASCLFLVLYESKPVMIAVFGILFLDSEQDCVFGGVSSFYWSFINPSSRDLSGFSFLSEKAYGHSSFPPTSSSGFSFANLWIGQKGKLLILAITMSPSPLLLHYGPRRWESNWVLLKFYNSSNWKCSIFCLEILLSNLLSVLYHGVIQMGLFFFQYLWWAA